MKRLLLASATAVGLTLAAGGAQAALLQIQGGTAYTTPADGGGWVGNQVIPNTNGFLDGTLVATQGVILTYEFIGFEASYTNIFNVDGAAVFTNQTTAPGTFVTTTSGPVALDFSFLIGTTPATLFGNGDTDPAGLVSIFLGATDNSGSRDSDVFYIALDDSGANIDDNHDDMVIRVTATAMPNNVPEPASLALFGAGLLGLGLARRRRA